MRMQVNADVDVLYFLVLNPMMSNTEACQQFGPFPTRQDVLAFYNSQLVPPYTDEGPNMFGSGPKMYNKSFKKDGPLEWYNILYGAEFETPGYHGHGIHEVYQNLKVNTIIGPASTISNVMYARYDDR